MKLSKTIRTLILAFCLIFSMLPSASFAEEKVYWYELEKVYWDTSGYPKEEEHIQIAERFESDIYLFMDTKEYKNADIYERVRLLQQEVKNFKTKDFYTTCFTRIYDDIWWAELSVIFYKTEEIENKKIAECSIRFELDISENKDYEYAKNLDFIFSEIRLVRKSQEYKDADIEGRIEIMKPTLQKFVDDGYILEFDVLTDNFAPMFILKHKNGCTNAFAVSQQEPQNDKGYSVQEWEEINSKTRSEIYSEIMNYDLESKFKNGFVTEFLKDFEPSLIKMISEGKIASYYIDRNYILLYYPITNSTSLVPLYTIPYSHSEPVPHLEFYDPFIRYSAPNIKIDINNTEISFPDCKTYGETPVIKTTKNLTDFIPEIEIKDGDKTLELGTDFTISYENNTTLGTATVTIEGIGDYEGTAEQDFVIAVQNDIDGDGEFTLSDIVTAKKILLNMQGYEAENYDSWQLDILGEGSSEIELSDVVYLKKAFLGIF